LKVRETTAVQTEGGTALPGTVNSPSSKRTLWEPPAFVHVTFSPTLTVTLAGMNWSAGVAVTA